MTVLYTIGFITVLITIFMLTAWLDGVSERKYGYKFFTWGNLTLTAIGYFMMVYGKQWLLEATADGGDILNGQILMGIGAVLIAGIFYNHIQKTSLWFGFLVGAYQLLLYVPASILGAFVLLAVVAFAMQTKPVYNIN